MPRWNPADDDKLIALFRSPRGGLDPNKLDVEDVKAAHQAHWPGMKYSNFSQRYREKARSFLANQTLNGHRKRKQPFTMISCVSHTVSYFIVCCSGSKEARGIEEFESDDDDDAEGISLGSEDTLDSDEEEEEEEIMPASTKKRSNKANTPARRKKPEHQDPSTEEESELASLVSKLNLGGHSPSNAWKPFNKAVAYSYLSYTYKRDGRDVCKVEVNVKPKQTTDFKVKVSGNGLFVTISERINPRFVSKARNDRTNRQNNQYNALSAAKQACDSTIDAVRSSEEDPNRIWTTPYDIPLPFACEEALISLRIKYHKDENDFITDKLGAEQFEGTIHIEMKSIQAVVDNMFEEDDDDVIDSDPEQEEMQN